jgi:hypothetical protein
MNTENDEGIMNMKHEEWRMRKSGKLEGYLYVKKYILIHTVCLSSCEDILVNTDRMRWILLSRTSKPKRVCDKTPLSCTLQKSVECLCVSRDVSRCFEMFRDVSRCWIQSSADRLILLRLDSDGSSWRTESAAWPSLHLKDYETFLKGCVCCLYRVSAQQSLFAQRWFRHAKIYQGSWPARAFGILGPFSPETNTFQRETCSTERIVGILCPNLSKVTLWRIAFA